MSAVLKKAFTSRNTNVNELWNIPNDVKLFQQGDEPFLFQLRSQVVYVSVSDFEELVIDWN